MPILVLTGLPGAGKSTLARALALRLGSPVISGDRLMDALGPLDEVLVRLPSNEYNALCVGLIETLIEAQLELDQTVIVDSVIGDAVVDRWRALAAARSSSATIVECVCSDEADHRARLADRVLGVTRGHAVSWSQLVALRDRFPPLSTPDIVVDSVHSVEDNAASVLAVFARPDGATGAGLIS